MLFNYSPILRHEPYQSNHKPKQSSSHSSPLSIGRQQQALISYPLCIHTIFLQPSSAAGIQQLRPTFISVNPACVSAPALTIQTRCTSELLIRKAMTRVIILFFISRSWMPKQGRKQLPGELRGVHDNPAVPGCSSGCHRRMRSSGRQS